MILIDFLSSDKHGRNITGTLVTRKSEKEVNERSAEEDLFRSLLRVRILISHIYTASPKGIH